MDSREIEAWAVAYIEAQQDPALLKGDHPLWWAVDRFMEVISDGTVAEDCWLAILEVLRREPPQAVLDILAAGPLEDIIEHCGPEFIDRIEVEARRSPPFRSLLRGVWQSSTPEIWARVVKAQAIAPE